MPKDLDPEVLLDRAIDAWPDKQDPEVLLDRAIDAWTDLNEQPGTEAEPDVCHDCGKEPDVPYDATGMPACNACYVCDCKVCRPDLAPSP